MLKSWKARLYFVFLFCCFAWLTYLLLKPISTAPIDVNLAGHNFKIPDNFIQSRDDHITSMEVLWPRFEPITSENSREFHVGSKTLLHIGLTNETTKAHIIDISNFHLKIDERIYRSYLQKGMKNVVYFGSDGDQDYFHTKDMHFYLTCLNDTSILPVHTCSSHFVALGDITAYVYFTTEHFDEFPSIIETLNSFLISHETKIQ